MMTNHVSKELLDWLLSSDPAIRWQVMRDVMKKGDDEVAVERSRVATEGWGAELLAMQEADGRWPASPPVEPRWKSTLEALVRLKEFGVDPRAPQVREAIERVRTQFTWGAEFGDLPFFEGETEPCINGRVLALGAFFGVPSERLLLRLLGEQLEDGGWNCEAPPSTRSSFHSTICVLEGLLAYEQTQGPRPDLVAARLRGQEYLVERKLFRSRATGQVIRPEWWQCAFPTDWHYDVLWGLDYLRGAGFQPEPRLAEAIEMLRSKRDSSGAWNLERVHAQDIPFTMETNIGRPSRWITLRALRVLAWAA